MLTVVTRKTLRILLVVLLASISLNSFSDPQSKSYSVWSIDGRFVSATYSITAREITRLPSAFNADISKALASYLVKQLEVDTCRVVNGVKALQAPSGYVRVELDYECQKPLSVISITNNAFFQLAPSHLHYAQVRWLDGGSDVNNERLFSRFKTTQVIASEAVGNVEAAQSDNTFAAYIMFGIEHILIGTDHIAFLLTLLLLIRSFKEIILVVTGFTLGHSITLCIATLGLATPNGPLVESLIGFTIALVAAENIAVKMKRSNVVGFVTAFGLTGLAIAALWLQQQGMALTLTGLAIFTMCYFMLSNNEGQARRMRPLVTASFGLIHGFGFSSVLMEVGVPEGSLLAALFGFNLGVEIGQVLIVSALSLLGFVTFKIFQRQQQYFVDALSTVLLAVGCYWFIGRAFMII